MKMVRAEFLIPLFDWSDDQKAMWKPLDGFNKIVIHTVSTPSGPDQLLVVITTEMEAKDELHAALVALSEGLRHTIDVQYITMEVHNRTLCV